MKSHMLRICIPVALLFAAGCATQSPNDTGTTSASESTSSSSAPATTSGTRSDRVASTPSTRSRSGSSRTATASGPGQPGERSVFFEFDKSQLSEDDRKLVEAHAQYLRQNPAVKVRIEGNADERGSKEYNLALGQRRAETVTKVMRILGVSDDRVEAVSYGEEKPLAKGHDEQAWSQNRRSDILY